MTDAPEELPADPRDAQIREQAVKIATLDALVGDLREQETLLREKSRNSASLPPSGRADDLGSAGPDRG